MSKMAGNQPSGQDGLGPDEIAEIDITVDALKSAGATLPEVLDAIREAFGSNQEALDAATECFQICDDIPPNLDTILSVATGGSALGIPPNHELNTHIRSQLAAGVSRAEIERELAEMDPQFGAIRLSLITAEPEGTDSAASAETEPAIDPEDLLAQAESDLVETGYAKALETLRRIPAKARSENPDLAARYDDLEVRVMEQQGSSAADDFDDLDF